MTDHVMGVGGAGASSPLYLRRSDAAAYIRSKYGFCTPKSLGKGAVTGDGPRFFKAGRAVLYTIADLDAWARSKISARSFASTSDAA